MITTGVVQTDSSLAPDSPIATLLIHVCDYLYLLRCINYVYVCCHCILLQSLL